MFPTGVNSGFMQSRVLPLSSGGQKQTQARRTRQFHMHKGAALLYNKAAVKKAFFSQKALGRMRSNSLHFSHASSHVRQRHHEKLFRGTTQESCKLSTPYILMTSPKSWIPQNLP